MTLLPFLPDSVTLARDGFAPHSSAMNDSDDPDRYLTGKLLIAMPAIADRRFERGVIYVCAHTQDGAMGIVVNHPLKAPTFDELARQLSIQPVPPLRRIDLCSGGPVDNGRGFVLHTSDWTSEESLLIDDEIALTASLDSVKTIAAGGGPRECILALGYAGWGPGQLDSELTTNIWLSAPSDQAILFGREHGTKWARALARLRIDPLQLSNVAGHA